MSGLVALVPARGGSKRIARKNIRPLAGHPLLAYTLAAARQAGIFSGVYVSTEDAEIATIANEHGANVITRPAELATDTSPDIEWVAHALDTLAPLRPDAFAILRPTSPFRTGETVRRAWGDFQRFSLAFSAHSLRAVETARQHPAKMWRRCGPYLFPLLLHPNEQPWHSSPTQSLPHVFAQNASLEIAWCHVVRNMGTIAGDRILPWEMPGYEGFDLNTEDDWLLAETLIERGKVTLPEVR